MALDRNNINPALLAGSWQPYSGYLVAPDQPTSSGGGGSAPGNRPGRGWEWVLDNGDDVIDTAGSLWCLINPRRPGCPGDPARQPVVVQSPVPPWLWVLLVVIVLLIVYLIFKSR